MVSVSDVAGVRTLVVDLSTKTVRATGPADPALVVAAIAAAGYAVGPLLGTAKVVASGPSFVTTAIKPTTGHHDLYIVFKNSEIRDKPMFNFGGIRLENK